MTIFENIKSMNIEELVNWIYKHDLLLANGTPWVKWFDKKYCNNCHPEIVHVPEDNNREMLLSWCEIHGKCKHFQDMNDIPDNKDMIKMWLESEIENEVKK